jgi:2-(1,2-epoxy-1,2-dihydrophenyl)acetyl-CoA isomerase
MKMPEFNDLNISLEDYVATVEISAGPMNFLSVPLLEHLVEVWSWADQTPDCRAIVLCAKGSVFSAGANFTDFMGGGAVSPEPLYVLAQQLFEGQTPVIAAIQGAAVGAGLGLAMIADERIASPNAKFVANFVQLGFHPGFALTASLPFVIGPANSASLLMSAERIKTDEALRIGLINECVDESSLLERAQVKAKTIAQNAPIAVRDVRKTLRTPLIEAVKKSLPHELATQLQHFITKDFGEGVAAMLGKRTPQFKDQ